MKITHFLVPTDFSDTAAGAYRFAQGLAGQWGGKITLLHVYHPSFDLNNPYLDVPASDFGDLKQKSLDQFAHDYELAEGERKEQGADTRLLVGFAAEEIIRVSEDYDLVIMGTTGEGNLLEQVFGSVSSEVARKALRPVMLIPAEATYRPFRQVMYASNYQPQEQEMLNTLMRDSGLSPEILHLVHADEEAGSRCRVARVQYEQFIRKGANTMDLRFVNVACEELIEGLHQYAIDQDIDLIIMGTIHRAFFERLFHRSLTQQMVFHTRIPLLITHFDD